MIRTMATAFMVAATALIPEAADAQRYLMRSFLVPPTGPAASWTPGAWTDSTTCSRSGTKTQTRTSSCRIGSVVVADGQCGSPMPSPETKSVSCTFYPSTCGQLVQGVGYSRGNPSPSEYVYPGVEIPGVAQALCQLLAQDRVLTACIWMVPDKTVVAFGTGRADKYAGDAKIWGTACTAN